jgi:hypothetical protein
VLTISGMSMLSHAPQGRDSYLFSIHPNCHGWAAWRRTWALYEHNIDTWPTLAASNWLLKIVGSRDEAKFWSKRFDLVRCGFDAWDYQLVFSCWKAGGVAVRPRHDLVKNIGFGPDATHTFKSQPPRRVVPVSFDLTHPKAVETWDVLRDRYRRRKSIRDLEWRNFRSSLRDRINRIMVRIFGPAHWSGRLRRLLQTQGEQTAATEPERLPLLGTHLELTDAEVCGLRNGWSYNEKHGRWTDGMQSSILWRVQDGLERDLVCCIDAVPALHRSQPEMTVDVFVNNMRCAATKFGCSPSHPGAALIRWVYKLVQEPNVQGIDRFLIRRGLFKDQQKVVMTLVIRWPLIPDKHGISDDCRALGLFCRSVRFELVDSP